MVQSDSRVLVLVPVFNDVKNIERCINSILSQNHKALELVILDNFSTDGTYEKLDFYKNRANVFLYRNTLTISASANWKKLYQIAKIERKYTYVCFVGSDDYWASNSYLSELVIALDYLPKDYCCISPTFCTFDYSTTNSASLFSLYAISSNKYFRILKLLNNWFFVNSLYSLHRAENFHQIFTGNFSQLNNYDGSDWWLAFALLKNSKVKSIPNALYMKNLERRPNYVNISGIDLIINTIKFPITHFLNEIGRFRNISFSRILDFIIIFIWTITHTCRELTRIIRSKFRI